MEKISVIIPVYNVEKYLEKCLLSVLAQTYTNLEILCINDGSKDHSLQICEQFQKKDSRIRIINQENRGLAAVRNVGIQEASCDYLAFVDSDDYIDSDFIEKLYTSLKANDADISVANVQYENTGNTYSLIQDLSTHKVVLNRLETMKEFLNPTGGLGNYLVNKLYKKEMFDGVYFPESKLFEDASTMFYILNNVNKAVIEQNTYYHYWIREDSITGTYDPTMNNFDLLYANKSKAYFVCEHYPELANLVFIQYFNAFRWFTNKSIIHNVKNDEKLKEFLSDLIKLKKTYQIKLNVKHKILFTSMCLNMNLYKRIYRTLRKKEN